MNLWTIQIGIQDSKGDKSTMTINLPVMYQFEQVEAYAEAIMPLIEPLIYGDIVACQVTRGVDVTVLPNAYGIADIQERAEMFFLTAEGAISRIAIPTIAEEKVSLKMGTAEHLTPGDADVVALSTAIESGINFPLLGVTVSPSNARGFDLTVYSGSRVIFRHNGPKPKRRRRRIL